MVLVTGKLGTTEVQLTARGRGNRIPPELLNIPGGLYPLKSAAFEVDQYRILSGWPVPVPECDVRVHCLVSAEGDTLGNRDDPTSLITNADMRWIADVNYYDQTSLQWRPIQSDVAPWTAPAGNAPILITDYEYRFGDERFVDMTALNFDSNTNDFMSINLDLSMGGTMGYTMIMVACPNSIYGNDETIVENAIWGPDATTGAWVMFTVKDQAIFMTTESQKAQRGVSVGTSLSSTAPSYFVTVVHRPMTTLYAASGPSNVQMKSLTAGASPTPLSTHFWLGNGPFSTVATMDMALLDLSIYGNPLTKSEVVAEITALSTIYGGDL